MIKSLNKGDIQVTPFIADKSWRVQNIDNDDLILWMSGSLSGSIAHMYIDYGDGTSAPITNSYCDLALLQQSNQIYITYQQGTNTPSTFFPVGNQYYDSSSNAVNFDGTYKNIVYNTHKQLFYNTYNNPTQIWGLENINLSGSKKLLTDTMDVFTLNRFQFGEKIIPNSIQIIDEQLDETYTIVDDGANNLTLKGTHFNNFQQL